MPVSESPKRPTSSLTPRPSKGYGADMAKGMSEASRGLSLAFGFVIVVLVFWFAGRLLDGWLGTEPWFQVAGTLIGWVLGVVTVYYSAQVRRN